MDNSDEIRIRQLFRGHLLSHPAFLKEVPNPKLDAFQVGRLVADAYRINELHAQDSGPVGLAAYSVLSSANQVGERHTQTTALEVLEVAADIARRDFETPLDSDQRLQHSAAERALERAARAIEGFDGELTPAMRMAAASLAGLPFDSTPRLLRLALAGIGGEPVLGEVLASLDATAADQPMYKDQLQTVALVGTKNSRLALEAARCMMVWSDAMDEDMFAPPGAHPLAHIEEFAASSRVWIERSVEHLAAIESGIEPFVSDKAFGRDDAHALARFVNLSLDRNEPWLIPLLEPLLMGTSVAPGSKKSAPSQAAAIGIAKAIAERPTTRALLALKSAKAKVRHAGLEKKFDRLIQIAERRLAARPDFILQFEPGFVPPKELLPAVRASFEALYSSGATFRMLAFEAQILANKVLAELAAKLIWRIDNAGSSTTAMPAKSKKEWIWQDADMAIVRPSSDSVVSLWHPLAPEPIADRWRDAILERKLAQPFNQVFRETYSLDEHELTASHTDLFAGHEVDAKVLIGVARATGWRLAHNEGFARNVGEFCFRFYCGDLYPGIGGSTLTGGISVTRYGAAARLGEVDPIALSEVLRQADLMASVAAFALKTDGMAPIEPPIEPSAPFGKPRRLVPGTRSAQRRREVLIRMFGESAHSEGPWVDGRYLCVRDARIHIATGLARQDGKALNLDRLKGASPLPYADIVLEKIVAQANAILRA